MRKLCSLVASSLLSHLFLISNHLSSYRLLETQLYPVNILESWPSGKQWDLRFGLCLLLGCSGIINPFSAAHLVPQHLPCCKLGNTWFSKTSGLLLGSKHLAFLQLLVLLYSREPPRSSWLGDSPISEKRSLTLAAWFLIHSWSLSLICGKSATCPPNENVNLPVGFLWF